MLFKGEKKVLIVQLHHKHTSLLMKAVFSTMTEMVTDNHMHMQCR